MINFMPIIYMKQKNSLKLYKPKLTQDEIENMNTPISIKHTEFLKHLLTEKTPDQDGFIGEFHQTFKGKINTNS